MELEKEEKYYNELINKLESYGYKFKICGYVVSPEDDVSTILKTLKSSEVKWLSNNMTIITKKLEDLIKAIEKEMLKN